MINKVPTNQELNVVVMPNRSLQLEWADAMPGYANLEDDEEDMRYSGYWGYPPYVSVA